MLRHERLQRFSEPVFVPISTVWRVEIHERDTEVISECEEGIDLSFGHLALRSCDALYREIVASHEGIEIPFIECVIEREVDRKIESSVSCGFRESEDLIESIS
jgi:hypothetical protein